MARYKAEFTAYYPANDKLNGGLYDALGNKLNPKNNTCAAPKSIPFHTKIKVSGTNTKYDNQTYEVTDRGSAIVVDDKGVYHIDLLMATKEECLQFGRRQGYIDIMDKVQSLSSSLKDLGNKNPNVIQDKKDYNKQAKVIGCDSLNVRETRPDANGNLGKLVFVLKEGDIITLGYVLNGWGSIYVNGKKGFVNVKYLKLI